MGQGVDDISDLCRSDVEIYAGKSDGVPIPGAGDGDAVSWLPGHGEDPADDGFGATRITNDGESHISYFTGKLVKNTAKIATGNRSQIYGE